jgi:hypothetical protein
MKVDGNAKLLAFLLIAPLRALRSKIKCPMLIVIGVQAW